MKAWMAMATAVAVWMAGAAHASDVSWSVTIGSNGHHRSPPVHRAPPVAYPAPVVVSPAPVLVQASPVVLYPGYVVVPPGHVKRWKYRGAHDERYGDRRGRGRGHGKSHHDHDH